MGGYRASMIGKWVVSSRLNLYCGVISISAYENRNFISTVLLYCLSPSTVSMSLYMFSPFIFSFSTSPLNLSLNVILLVQFGDSYLFSGRLVTSKCFCADVPLQVLPMMLLSVGEMIDLLG